MTGRMKNIGLLFLVAVLHWYRLETCLVLAQQHSEEKKEEEDKKNDSLRQHQELHHDAKDITVLGLGSMGQAFVKCLLSKTADSKTSIERVHAWNRGIEKRLLVQEMGAIIYETALDAIQASNITLILIDDWDGIQELIHQVNDMDNTVWNNKKIVLFSTYTPTDIIELQKQYFAAATTKTLSTVLVGGAIIGVPQTICTNQTFILLSESVSQLHNIGRVDVFTGSIGHAALVNIALILVITFGIAGQELAHLILQQYSTVIMKSDYTNDFYTKYISLSSEIGPTYTKMLLPITSQSIITQRYDTIKYVPIRTLQNVLQMYIQFMIHIGIQLDTNKATLFLVSYVNSLQQVQNNSFGPAAWIEEFRVVTNNPNKDNSNSTNEDVDDKEL